MTFKPRRGRNNYVHQSGGSYFYRRRIPADYQPFFDNRKEWWVLLSGRTHAERQAEAMRIADSHNRALHDIDEKFADQTWGPPWSIRVVSAEPPGPSYPLRRNGFWRKVESFAVVGNAASRAAATRLGLEAVTEEEFKEQEQLRQARETVEAADDPERREFAEFKFERATRAFDARFASTAPNAPTLQSIMNLWRAHRKQAPTMWKKHVQYVGEFVALHGDLPLTAITKRHVLEYLDHAMSLKGPKGEPLSPSSVTKRLDTIKAALSFANSRDLIAGNPAHGVKPPEDHRPEVSRHWKAFTKSDIRKLLEVSDYVWDTRRASRHVGRKEDLKTALRMLVWTGARPEEICQLRVSDVDVSRCVVTVTNDDTDDEDGGLRARRLKNERSVRVVPIHSRLLPTVVKHLTRLKVRGSNSPLLFPSFAPEPTSGEIAEAERTGRPVEIKGRYARPLSREWTDNLKHLVTNDPRKVLYSLRHAWSAESRDTGMPEHVRNALMGHANDNPHADSYGADRDWTEIKRAHLDRMDCVGPADDESDAGQDLG